MLSYYQGGALSSSTREQMQKNGILRFPKFPMQWTNEGGEVLELGGAHLAWRNSSPYIGDASVKYKKHILSKYDNVSVVSKTKQFLPNPLLWLVG